MGAFAMRWLWCLIAGRPCDKVAQNAGGGGGGECPVEIDVYHEYRKKLFCSMANHCPKHTTTYSMLRR